MRSERAETISKVAWVRKPFFRGGPPGDFASSFFVHSVQEGTCIPHAEYIVAGAEPSLHGSQGHRPTGPTSSDSRQPTKLAANRYVFKTFSIENSSQFTQNGTPKIQMITQGPWVLQVVQGYKIEFITVPVQQFQPHQPCLSSMQETVLKQKVEDLPLKQAVHPVPIPHQEPGFISSVFVVPKKDGGNRPLVNLKPLSQYLVNENFKMEGTHMLRDLPRKGDFLVKMDLKGPYLTVPVWKDHQKFLRFVWKNSLMEFCCLTSV